MCEVNGEVDPRVEVGGVVQGAKGCVRGGGGAVGTVFFSGGGESGVTCTPLMTTPPHPPPPLPLSVPPKPDEESNLEDDIVLASSTTNRSTSEVAFIQIAEVDPPHALPSLEQGKIPRRPSAGTPPPRIFLAFSDSVLLSPLLLRCLRRRLAASAPTPETGTAGTIERCIWPSRAAHGTPHLGGAALRPSLCVLRFFHSEDLFPFGRFREIPRSLFYAIHCRVLSLRSEPLLVLVSGVDLKLYRLVMRSQ